MKIIDEKGRLFKLINIVDLMVMIALILALLAIGVKLFAAPIKEATSPNVTMTTVARVRGVTKYMQAELERNPLQGKQLVSGTSYIDAYITDVQIEDYENQGFSADGQIVSSIDPVKKDYVVTIQSKVPAGTPTPKIGNQEIRAGRTMILKTNDFEMNANVESVIIDDGNTKE